MQITELEVKGLFGRLDYRISFPEVDEADPSSSVTIIYGINGVGKTTLLKFLDGFLREERGGRFDIFRAVPFEYCEIRISNIAPFSIRPVVQQGDRVLRIEFEGESAIVGGDPRRRTVASEREVSRARALQDRFQEARSELSFQFLQTARLENIEDLEAAAISEQERAYLRGRAVRAVHERESLSHRMRLFIANAQLDYRTFFASSGVDLFQRIMERLSEPKVEAYNKQKLIRRLYGVLEKDKAAAKFGLELEEWDFGQLKDILKNVPGSGKGREHTLTIFAQYVEMLEARAGRRGLVEERLATFERVMNEFLVGKRVSVTAKEGLRVETDDDARTLLSEQNLSSGERHLLYLMASALMTRRKGTVIAIDEPEMSMHIAWQRKLIPALMKCAARAEPQFIFATHSPELLEDYQDRLVELRA